MSFNLLINVFWRDNNNISLQMYNYNVKIYLGEKLKIKMIKDNNDTMKN